MNGPVSLLKLPPEILGAILSVVRSSLDTLKALSQSCHHLHAIATPFLYSSVVIRSPESMSCFLETAANSHYLTSLIRELQIHYHDLDEDTDNSPEDIEPALPKLVNLESLIIKSSWFDWVKPSKMQLLCHPQETLPALRSVTLSLDYGYEWSFPLGSYGVLLHHPAPFRSTRLQELRLLNCDIKARDIEEMLRYPHQLKHFTIKGQEERSELGCFGDSNRQLYIDALRSHSSSLETLDIDLQFDEWKEPMDLSNFSALQSLTISPRMLIGDNGCFWLKPASTLDWAKLLPSNLQHLKFRNDCGVFPILQIYEALREGYIRLRSLTCQIASNVLEDGSPYFEESDLDSVTPEGIRVFRSPNDLMSEVSPDGVSYSQGFQGLGVGFFVVEVSRTEKLPGLVTFSGIQWRGVNDEIA
ncbi:hypothetical protein PEX1_025260 [Penicillium expansum]|uniref:Uncharacterized protein n=1 Tax=Penicillium expansum TaxID=27334 RepID=A0A0A2KBQ6_PENEN|nr:hypothetical protein PEX2_016960 [Penicillium expansum]KGO61790.1 hypothetical protein PEX2_016960 [Penicillium expansum]KGO68990.1 hypothetical protein PEX1_025260 [Penicillium expansum]